MDFETDFETKDSGEREEFDSGMRRDVQAGKPRYDLIDRPFLRRWAELMARGASKYGENNWRLADSEVEFNRFQASALRHMFQWLEGDRSEDHAAAVAFNLAGAESLLVKLRAQWASELVESHRSEPGATHPDGPEALKDASHPECCFDC
jgi:hypothetical protein